MAGGIVPSTAEVSIDPQQLKNSLLVTRTSDKLTGFRVKVIDANEEDIPPYIGCATFNLDDGQMVRLGIALNGNGNPALILFHEAD